MSYKDLLVHLDPTKAANGRMAAAIALAREHEAHLSGLALAVEPNLPPYIWGQLPADFAEMRRREAAKEAEAVTDALKKAADSEGVQVEARSVSCLESEAEDALAIHVRHADLAVFGQPDPDDARSLEQRVIENIVFAGGRPVLLIPYVGARGPIGRRVVIAWDGGREAARAVNDSLPLLKRAESVTVLVIDPESRPAVHGQEPGADIGLHLARHGIKVEVARAQSDGLSVGELLLSRLADRNADLLVMGAYGHSRVREMALGGVTRTILDSMTVPVLLSH